MSAFSLPGPEDIHQAQLPNGIRVLVRSHPHSPSVVIRGALWAGARWDPLPKMGLATLTAAMLKRGTARFDASAFYEALESRGAHLGFEAYFHTVGFSGHGLAEDLPLLLTLLAQALTAPTFPEDEFQRLRAQVLTGLDLRRQSPDDMAELAFHALLYQGHPYARPEEGFPETVQNVTREDLVAFHRRHYGPRGMLLVIVGGVEPQQALDEAARALAGWENPEQPKAPPLPPVPRPQTARKHFVPVAEKSQVDLYLGVVGPRRKDPDYLAAALGNSVLGQFGMMGRLGEVVREQAGLAYYVYSQVGNGLGPGPWFVHAGVAPENVPRALELIQGELQRFWEHGVTEEELEDVKAGALGRLPLSLEHNAGVAAAIFQMVFYDLGLDYLQRYEGLIRDITQEAVLDAIRRYWDLNALTMALAGPAFPGAEEWPQGEPSPAWFQ